MIQNLKFPAAVALTFSLGAHLAGFGITAGQERTQIQGGAPQTVAMLGNSLANMVESVTEPVESVEPLTPETPVSDTPLRHAPQQPALTLPKQAETPAVPELRRARPDELAALPVSTSQTPLTTLPVTPMDPEMASATTPAALSAVEPSQAAPAKPVEPVTVTVTPDTVTARDPVEVQTPDLNTPRPKTRPDPQKVEPKRSKPQTTQPKKKTTRTAKVESAQAARKGQADGSKDAKATQSSKSSGKAQAAGNAAASNYPGKIMRKIQRTRKESAGARGTATVAFRITASGGVSSLRIQKSSGSAKVDQIALRHIQRAAPFPPPPNGARTTFNLKIVSKG